MEVFISECLLDTTYRRYAERHAVYMQREALGWSLEA